MKKLFWIFSAAAYLLIAFVFIKGLHGTPIGYAAYLLSAVALVADLIVLIPRLIRIMKAQIMKTKVGARFLTDFAFKERLLLFVSFAINAAYVLMNLVNGISNRSAWAITFAVYYLAIGSMRLFLFRSLQLDGLGKEPEKENRRYVRCGIAIMLMAIPFAGIVTLMVKDNLGYHYAQIIIYAMAAYVFYSVISCVINIIRYRKYKSPVLSAAKRISFISALVSLIGLQTAMLEQFNSDSAFRTDMVSKTGIVLLIIIFVTGLEMTVRGKVKINKIDVLICGGSCHAAPISGKNVGKTCRTHYRGTFNDGTQFDSSYDRGEPLEFVCGAGMMIPGYDKAVADMEVGETINIHLMPEEAYGMPDPAAIFTVEIAQMPGSEELSVGQQVYLQNMQGKPFPVKVIGKDEQTIMFDANHEMAGKELNFTIELVEVL